MMIVCNFVLDDISLYKYIYTSKKNGISIIEAPIAPQNKVPVNMKHSYAYKILDANGVITEDLEVEMFYPQDVHDYIDISGFITSRDENKFRCDYIIKKESNIIFQPKIKIRFSGKEQDLVPFEPICFFIN